MSTSRLTSRSLVVRSLPRVGFLSCLMPAHDARAQSSITTPLALSRLEGAVSIDGMPDEPAWQAIPAVPLTTYTPVFRGTPTQRSEIRVAYDDDDFYAAGWFYDSDPSGIRVNSLDRDRWNADDDGPARLQRSSALRFRGGHGLLARVQ